VTEGCHHVDQQAMSQVGFRLKDRIRADPNRPRLRQGSDPADPIFRDQARRDSEVAHQYLSELANRRAGR
jgi:hypothetical protein